MYWEITCFKVHIAYRLNGVAARGAIGTGGLSGCESS